MYEDEYLDSYWEDQNEVVEYDRFQDDYNVWEENQIALDNEYEDNWENLYGGDDYD